MSLLLLVSNASMMKMRGLVAHIGTKEVMIIDILEDDEVEFLAAKDRIDGNLVGRWQGPMRSPGTTGVKKRIMYTGIIEQEGPWAARLTLMEAKKEMLGIDAVLGLFSTFSNPEAILIDISGTEVGTKVQELTEDAVFISPRLMLARTEASEQQWRKKTEEVFDCEGGVCKL